MSLQMARRNQQRDPWDASMNLDAFDESNNMNNATGSAMNSFQQSSQHGQQPSTQQQQHLHLHLHSQQNSRLGLPMSLGYANNASAFNSAAAGGGNLSTSNNTNNSSSSNNNNNNNNSHSGDGSNMNAFALQGLGRRMGCNVLPSMQGLPISSASSPFNTNRSTLGAGTDPLSRLSNIAAPSLSNTPAPGTGPSSSSIFQDSLAGLNSSSGGMMMGNGLNPLGSPQNPFTSSQLNNLGSFPPSGFNMQQSQQQQQQSQQQSSQQPQQLLLEHKQKMLDASTISLSQFASVFDNNGNNVSLTGGSLPTKSMDSRRHGMFSGNTQSGGARDFAHNSLTGTNLMSPGGASAMGRDYDDDRLRMGGFMTSGNSNNNNSQRSSKHDARAGSGCHDGSVGREDGSNTGASDSNSGKVESGAADTNQQAGHGAAAHLMSLASLHRSFINNDDENDAMFDVNLPFPVKLHHILSRDEYKNCITWLPHGRAWRILKPKLFEEKVIPKYYRSAKYASFMRQVNGWGFTRITEGPDLNAYYHEMFLRGLPNLCSKMKRPPKGKDSTKNSKEVEGTPDFYKIDRMAPLPSSNTGPDSLSRNLPPLPTLAEIRMMGTRAGSSMMGGWDQAASGGASGHLGGSPMPLKASSGGAGKKPSIDVMTTSTAAAGLSLGSSALDGFHGSVTSAGVQAVTSSSGGTNILDGSSQHTSSTTSGSATGYPVDSRSSGQQNLTGADQNYLAHQNRILIQHAMRVEQQLAEADLVTRTRIQAQK